MKGGAPRFDRVARIYRPMEYLSFGPMLERCRFALIPRLAECRRALIFGDGDGRVVARMLAAFPEMKAQAVDASPAMLRLLTQRVERGGARERLRVSCVDARVFSPDERYDLVVTHFFLDCLTEEETRELIGSVRGSLVSGARWVVSEFEVGGGGPVRRGAFRLIVTGLYAAFRLLTGLRTRRIPPWRELLAGAGFVAVERRTYLGGLLVSELWQLAGTTAAAGCSSQRG